MTARIVNPLEIRDWNRQIEGLPGVTIFHTAHWARVLAHTYGYLPCYICTIANQKVTNLVPMMAVSSIITGKRGVCLPFTDWAEPLFTQKKVLSQLLAVTIAFAKKQGWKTISFHGGDSVFKEADAYERFTACRVLLEKDPDLIVKRFRSSTRRNIKKAERVGVTTRICHSLESVRAFYQLNRLTRKRHGLPPQPFSFFKNLHRHLIRRKKGFVCLGYADNRVVAGLVFLHYQDHAIYKYGASDRRYFYMRPNDITFRDALLHAVQIGCRSVDLGKTEQHNKGLMQFKRGWSPVESSRYYFKLNCHTGQFIKGRPGLKSSYPFFRHMPIPILELCGKLLYRHVG